MRLLVCSGGMVVIGGLEAMILQVLRAVRSRGGDVHCIVSAWAPDAMVNAAGDLGASWSVGSYRPKLRRSQGLLTRVGYGWELLRTSAALLRDARRFRPTVVLLPDFTAVLRNVPALWFLRLRGIRTVLALQNSPAPGVFYRRLWRWIVDPCVDRYVCSSRFCQQELIRHGIDADKTEVVYNTAPIREAATAGPRDERRVIFVGQLIPEKGLDLLVDAVGLLRQSGADVNLDVVGRTDAWVGPGHEGFRERVFARAAEPDLAGHVRFLGWRDDVPALMRGARVHCIPSRPEMHEGLPLVVVEAKRAGIPSVAFAHGPFPELIDHERTGWLARELNASSLADGLRFFLDGGVDSHDRETAIHASEAAFRPDVFEAGWWKALHGDADDAREWSRPAARAGQAR